METNLKEWKGARNQVQNLGHILQLFLKNIGGSEGGNGIIIRFNVSNYETAIQRLCINDPDLKVDIFLYSYYFY